MTKCVMNRILMNFTDQRRGWIQTRTPLHYRRRKNRVKKTKDILISYHLVSKEYYSRWLIKLWKTQSHKYGSIVSKVSLTLQLVHNLSKNLQKSSKNLISHSQVQILKEWPSYHKITQKFKFLKSKKQHLCFKQKTNQILHGLSNHTYRMRRIETSVNLLIKSSNQESRQ